LWEERVNEGNKGDRIWLMGFIYIHEIGKKDI
jgi:hypothetical protein